MDIVRQRIANTPFLPDYNAALVRGGPKFDPCDECRDKNGVWRRSVNLESFQLIMPEQTHETVLCNSCYQVYKAAHPIHNAAPVFIVP